MLRSNLPRFELQGHRGARGLFPENTLEGIAAAIALGVDAIELDVAVTADGVAVVFHDVALNPDLVRDDSGAWLEGAGPLIWHLTHAELGRFDVGRVRPGSQTAKRFPEQAPCDGARLPTLADVLALTAKSGVRADIELKTLPDRPDATVTPTLMADAVIAIATHMQVLDRIDVRSFDWRGLRRIAETQPAVSLTWLTSGTTVAACELWWDRPVSGSVAKTIAAAGGRTWAPEYPDLTREAVEEAHALDVRVIPWTVDEPADIARLIDWGVDGICTDRPDIARKVMRDAGLRVPSPPAI